MIAPAEYNILFLMNREIIAKIKETENINQSKKENIEDISINIQKFEEKAISLREKLAQIRSAWNIKKDNMEKEYNQLKL